MTITYEYVIPEDAAAGTQYDNIVVVNGVTVPVVNPQNPENPDGTPNYLPDIPVSDSDDEQVWTLRKAWTYHREKGPGRWHQLSC